MAASRPIAPLLQGLDIERQLKHFRLKLALVLGYDNLAPLEKDWLLTFFREGPMVFPLFGCKFCTFQYCIQLHLENNLWCCETENPSLQPLHQHQQLCKAYRMVMLQTARMENRNLCLMRRVDDRDGRTTVDSVTRKNRIFESTCVMNSVPRLLPAILVSQVDSKMQQRPDVQVSYGSTTNAPALSSVTTAVSLSSAVTSSGQSMPISVNVSSATAKVAPMEQAANRFLTIVAPPQTSSSQLLKPQENIQPTTSFASLAATMTTNAWAEYIQAQAKALCADQQPVSQNNSQTGAIKKVHANRHTVITLTDIKQPQSADNKSLLTLADVASTELKKDVGKQQATKRSAKKRMDTIMEKDEESADEEMFSVSSGDSDEGGQCIRYMEAAEDERRMREIRAAMQQQGSASGTGSTVSTSESHDVPGTEGPANSTRSAGGQRTSSGRNNHGGRRGRKSYSNTKTRRI